MEPKPFSIQAPEDIAKTYAGDKQRIMQAAQMGVVDPTAAVLAGMFIDRMRAPQGLEGTQPTTVAQQVLGNAPAQPPVQAPPPQPQMQMSPAGGLGATAPAMEAPPEAPAAVPAMAEGGMVPPYASGGLSDAPVPDGMFDEPSNGGFNDGYAGGGLVAFGSGGVAYDDFARVIPIQESRGNYRARNRESGALGKYQLMPATARALAQRLGLGYNEALLTSDTAAARQYQDALGAAAMQEAWGAGKGDPATAAMYYHGGSNRKIWGPRTRKYADDILGRLGASPELPELDISSRDARQRASLLEDIDLAGGLMSDLPHKYRDEMTDYLESERSPEAAKKRKRDDMWEAIGQFGAALATSPGNFLTGLSGAVAKTLPEVTASAKERKTYERDLLKDLMATEDLARKDAKDVIDLGKSLWAADVDAETRERALLAELADKAAAREATATENALDRDVRREEIQVRTAQERDFQMAFSTHLADLRTKNAQGIPIRDVNGVLHQGKGGGPMSEEALKRIALGYAAQTIQATRASSGASQFQIPGLGGTPAAGAGASTDGVIDFNNMQ